MKSDKSAKLLDLADAIAGPRPTVAAAFGAVAASRQDPVAFEAIAVGVRNDRDAYLAALTYAKSRGWLADLVHSLLEARTAKANFVASASKLLPKDPRIAALQASQKPGDSAFQPDVLCALLAAATSSVCRIEIDGQPAGTGSLIAPGLVLTGYHVVMPLLSGSAAQTAARLKVVFDDRVVIGQGVKRRLELKTEAVNDDWLVDSSVCPAEELLERSYDDQDYLARLDSSSGPWDFAVLRLRRPVEALRGSLKLHDLSVEVHDPILVLHHSQGRSMTLTIGRIERLTATRTRFFHSVWTEPGASGGPCLGAEGRLVGIHQAGPKTVRSGAAAPPNRAIPILPLISRLERAISSVSTEPAPMTALGDGHPILGRDQLQSWVWRATGGEPAGGGAIKPILLVLSSKRGRGARFTDAILRSSLPADRHLVVFRDASNFIALTPAELAADLVTATTGNLPALPVDGHDSAEIGWIRRVLVPETLKAIGASRGERRIWLVLRFPPGLELPDKTGIRETLEAFYAEAVAHHPWMRLILLTSAPTLPQSLVQLAEIERLRPIDTEDILTYCERRWIGSGVIQDRLSFRHLVDQEIQRLDPELETYQKDTAQIARWLDQFAQAIGRAAS